MFMQKTKPVLLILGLLCASLTGAIAQDASLTPAAANKILLKASAPFEDAIGPALAHNAKGIAGQLAAADDAAEGVKSALPADAAKKFGDLLQTIHKAADAKDDFAVAQNCLTTFRLLVDNLRRDALKVPVEVELLDYAGYQIQILAAGKKPDWNAMSKTAADAAAWWKELAPKVTAKHVREATTSALSGLSQAAQEKNPGKIQLAAQMTLDLVDVMEDVFKGKL